jgi:hypothetical protein
MALQFSTTIRNAMLDAITTAIGASGLLRIYTGSVPANVAAAIGAVTLLAELVMNATYAPAASAGVLTLNAITQDSSADNTGTAAWWRQWKSDGTTGGIQGTVTATGGGGDLELNTTSIVAGGPVAVTSWTITAPGA